MGEVFEGVVVDVEEKDGRRGEISIARPAVEAPLRAEAELPLGTDVRARLARADVRERRVEFTLEA